MTIHRMPSPQRHFVFGFIVFALVAAMTFEIWGLPAFSKHANAQSATGIITISQNLSQTLSGVVPFTVTLSSSGGQSIQTSILIDGTGLNDLISGHASPFDTGNPANYSFDTTKFLNGQHVFYVGDTNVNTAASVAVYGPVTFTINNGHTAMQLRANYNELWLTPGQSVQLTPKIIYTDNVTLPISAASTTFLTASSSVATVDSNGNVFAAGLGDTSITLTSGSFTDTVLVHVNPQNVTPHFGTNGAELTS
jgi:Bacterial Ig-like domain (group 2)